MGCVTAKLASWCMHVLSGNEAERLKLINRLYSNAYRKKETELRKKGETSTETILEACRLAGRLASHQVWLLVPVGGDDSRCTQASLSQLPREQKDVWHVCVRSPHESCFWSLGSIRLT